MAGNAAWAAGTAAGLADHQHVDMLVANAVRNLAGRHSLDRLYAMGNGYQRRQNDTVHPCPPSWDLFHFQRALHTRTPGALDKLVQVFQRHRDFFKADWERKQGKSNEQKQPQRYNVTSQVY